jgi:leucyl aminopeptidase
MAKGRPDIDHPFAPSLESSARPTVAAATAVPASATHQGLVEQVKAAAEATGEPVWQLPLHRPYRRMLDSGVADLLNRAPVGKPDMILASLFLAEFVGGEPWAHVDICGPAQNDEDRTWHPAGCSGSGARVLVELATGFKPPSAS